MTAPCLPLKRVIVLLRHVVCVIVFIASVPYELLIWFIAVPIYCSPQLMRA